MRCERGGAIIGEFSAAGHDYTRASETARSNAETNLKMKKIFLLLTVLAMLSGCAAQAYKTARGNGNQVKNGMTVAQASEILGMPPTHTIGDRVQWRRGNAQKYDATASGAIEFRVVDGRIVDVPEGGIFSPAAVAKFNAEWVKQRQAADAERARADAEQAERDRIAAEDRKAQEEQDQAERVVEIAAEMDAAEKSIVICKDKVSCDKVFSLAQIYVQQNADQKIQVATNTIIETYNPTEEGKIAITVIKMPRAGTLELVKITPSCKEGNHFGKYCRQKRTSIYRGFKPFIEQSLAK